MVFGFVILSVVINFYIEYVLIVLCRRYICIWFMILRGLTCLKRRDTFIPIYAKILRDHGVILRTFFFLNLVSLQK